MMEGLFLPVGVDLHQITILPKAEWQRIQDSLAARARETARILAEKKARKDLHLKSQALVKNWTHTIAVRRICECQCLSTSLKTYLFTRALTGITAYFCSGI